MNERNAHPVENRAAPERFRLHGVATQRAWIMISVMLLAVLMDRRAITMRSVAVSALVILAFDPKSLLSPGFQMSFAAVTALIAAYEWLGARADPDRCFTWGARLRR